MKTHKLCFNWITESRWYWLWAFVSMSRRLTC